MNASALGPAGVLRNLPIHDPVRPGGALTSLSMYTPSQAGTLRDLSIHGPVRPGGTLTNLSMYNPTQPSRCVEELADI